ncbi:MAG: hypothetical protein LBB26_02855 [Puniceicoccales bacterium]|nr:hypothetical protein [Puniceicoccales bacterium]
MKNITLTSGTFDGSLKLQTPHSCTGLAPVSKSEFPWQIWRRQQQYRIP